MPFSALVTGANRGIGLELVRGLVSGPDPADHVFATCRNVDDCKDLRDIQQKHGNLHILQLDVCDEASYPRLVQEVQAVVQGAGLNLLINNAGTAALHDLENVNSKEMMHIYSTNCVAPLMLAKAFLPLMKAAAAGVSGDAMSYRRAAVVSISSRMASIADNGMGRFYGYRASKTALNSVTRSLGIDLRSEHILALTMDPGWVQTRMGGTNAKITAVTSAADMLAALTKMGSQHTATFVDRFGQPVPW